MLKTLRLSFSLRNTYRVNSILYSLKQVPLIKEILPDSLYRFGALKTLANLLSVIWELLSIFIWKILYFFTLVCGVGFFYEKAPGNEAFLHILFFLTLIGSYVNSNLFSSSQHKYYAIGLLRMNAREYSLVNYGYSLLKTILGFLPCTIFFGLEKGVPLWLCILIPFGVAGAKLVMAADSLRDYKKSGTLRSDGKVLKQTGILTGIFVALAYLLPAAGIVLPFELSALLWVLLIPAGLISLRYLLGFEYYREFNQELFSQMFDQMDTMKNATKTAGERSITADSTITSQKKGFEYLNELFIKRHQKILWRSSVRIGEACALIIAVILGYMFIDPSARPPIRELVLNTLPLFSFVMYMINRGTSFTTALFTNCDRSLLTYSFYKRPKEILQLFQIRLREIIKINAFPAIVIGTGLCLILAFSGGTENPLHYLVLMVTILSMSVFFSIHYLTLYYLLQPYTAGTEIKSGTYRIALALTYLVCYGLIQVRMPLMTFGLSCIGFCVIYSAVASILVYYFAPETFRIRI